MFPDTFCVPYPPRWSLENVSKKITQFYAVATDFSLVYIIYFHDGDNSYGLLDSQDTLLTG